MYSFQDENRTPLYIGKTIHPKTRIRQHLKQAEEAGSKQREFVKLANEIVFYPVDSEIESLLLEARLIKLHQPVYNSIQKDDKTSLFIEVTRDEFPRVRLIRGGEVKNDKNVYGPFRTSQEAEAVLRVSRRVFRFCQSPPQRGKNNRPCFYYHINQCGGVCAGKMTKTEYRIVIGYLRRFLNGRSKGLLAVLVKKIHKLALEEKFEQAEKLKKMYEAVYWATQTSRGLASFLRGGMLPEKGIKELQRVLQNEGIETSLEKIEGYDVATLQQKNTVGAMVVFFLGTAEKKSYRIFKIKSGGGDTGAMKEMLRRRFWDNDWEKPDLVMVDGGKPQLSTALKVIPSSIPVIALAKKEETIVIKKGRAYIEIQLPRRSLGLKLLQQIRDEAHRFGTGFHKRLRNKVSLE